MILNACLFFLMNTCFYTIYALPYARHKRQIRLIQQENLPYEGWGGGSNNPSGAIPGAYYGSGLDPNYGYIGVPGNNADTNMHVLNYYDHDSNTPIHSVYNPQQVQQSQQYMNNNNNNRWQGSNMNTYYNQPYNRYPPGSQGWYATGGNYWYSKGQSLAPYTCLFLISIVLCMFHIY